MRLFTLMFLFLNFIENKEKKIVFFLVQEVSTFVFLFAILFVFPVFVILITLFMKIAVPPLHFWFLSILKRIVPLSLILFLTVIKIIPFYIVRQLFSFFYIFILCVIMLLRNLIIYNSVKARELFLFSSALNFFWFCTCFLVRIKLFFLYLFFYLFLIFKLFELNVMQEKIVMTVFVFVILIGTPPFFIFFLKWVIISIIAYYTLFLTIIILIIVLSTFSYFRVFYQFYIINLRKKYKKYFMYIYFYSIFVLFIYYKINIFFFEF